MAVLSKRDTILGKLKTNMLAIKTADGFFFDVKTVSRDIVNPDRLGADDFPAILINASVEDLAHRFFQKTENELKPIISMHVRPSTGQSLAEVQEQMICDIKKAFYADIDFKDPANPTVPLAVTSLLGPQIRVAQSSEPPLASVEIDVVILYRHPRQTP